MDLDLVETFCRRLLTSIHREDWCFTYFTAHDSSHTEAVWKLAKKIAAKKLSPYELLVLEAACLCHDIGMAKVTGEDRLVTDINWEYCEHVRKNHHLRSEEFVNTFKDKMGLDTNEASIIGKICYSHSSKADLNELDDTNLIYDGPKLEEVRTKLLGAILRISDALDASKDRLPLESYLEDATFESKQEYLKHMVTTKVSISSNRILVELTNQPRKEVMLIREKLNEEFLSVEEILKDAGLIYQLEFKHNEITIDPARLKFIPKDVKRINELFVKPSFFYEICDRLKKYDIVIISGDANVGKTSTANYIAGRRLKENNNPILILRPGKKFHPPPSNHTIIIDDAFGESEFENRFSIGYNDFIHLKEENKLILTSREHVLISALRKYRIGEEEYNNWKVELTQEGSYSDDALKQILFKHLRYYLENGKINEEYVEIAVKHQKEIISVLRFPHNIDIFVKEKLKDVHEGKKLENAIEESKHIKRVAKHWFLSLDDTRKFFVFTVWLFPTKMDSFEKIYPNTIEILRRKKPSLELEDINELIKRTSSFIVYDKEYALNEDKIHFRHQNYREGVNDAINESLGLYILSLDPLFKHLYENHGFLVRETVNNSLKQILSLNSEWAFKLFENLIRYDNWRVKAEISLILGEFRYINPDESIALLKVLAEDDDWRVREYVAEALVFGFDNLVEFEHFRPDESYELLKNLADDANFFVKSKVAESLGKFGSIQPDESIALLKVLAETNDCLVKSKVAESLGKFGFVRPDESIALLKVLAEDDDWQVRKTVLNALFSSVEQVLENEDVGSIDVGFLRFNSAFTILENFIFDEDWRVKECLGYDLVLGLVDKVNFHCYDPSEFLVLLNKLIDEGNYEIKVAVSDALIEWGHMITMECGCLLNKLVNNADCAVRKVCDCTEINRILKDDGITWPEYSESDDFNDFL